jgi:hypothetical protein
VNKTKETSDNQHTKTPVRLGAVDVTTLYYVLDVQWAYGQTLSKPIFMKFYGDEISLNFKRNFMKIHEIIKTQVDESS